MICDINTRCRIHVNVCVCNLWVFYQTEMPIFHLMFNDEFIWQRHKRQIEFICRFSHDLYKYENAQTHTHPRIRPVPTIHTASHNEPPSIFCISFSIHVECGTVRLCHQDCRRRIFHSHAFLFISNWIVFAYVNGQIITIIIGTNFGERIG